MVQPRCLKGRKDLHSTEKAIQRDLVVLSAGLLALVHPKCPRADVLSPLPGAMSPGGLALQLGEQSCHLPFFWMYPMKGFTFLL